MAYASRQLLEQVEARDRQVREFEQKLAGYAGTTPRVHASGGKTRFGAIASGRT